MDECDSMAAPSDGPKVFVQRDYSNGMAVQFQKKYPAELNGLVDARTYEETIDTINRLYLEAEKSDGGAFCEGCLACLTAYMIFFCMKTRYEKKLASVRTYIEEQNQRVFVPRGVLLVDPAERGLRTLEISILNTGRRP